MLFGGRLVPSLVFLHVADAAGKGHSTANCAFGGLSDTIAFTANAVAHAGFAKVDTQRAQI